ncbi:MAG: response regulator [Bacteroidota bacterium]
MEDKWKDGYLLLHSPTIEQTVFPVSAPVKVLIVEDEMIIAAKISMHLEQLGYEVSGILSRGEKAVVHCRESPPDILLLDINLKGMLDGIETAKVIRKEMELPIIFLTANSDQATFDRAKYARPQAFLAKPYQKQELERAIELAVLSSYNLSDEVISPEANKEKGEVAILSDRIFVRHKDRMVKVFLRDIQYVVAERAYCRIVTKQTDYLLSLAMGHLEKQLEGSNIIRIHRSYLVNLDWIEEVGEKHVVVEKEFLPIGKAYQGEVTRRLNLIK